MQFRSSFYRCVLLACRWYISKVVWKNGMNWMKSLFISSEGLTSQTTQPRKTNKMHMTQLERNDNPISDFLLCIPKRGLVYISSVMPLDVVYKTYQKRCKIGMDCKKKGARSRDRERERERERESGNSVPSLQLGHDASIYIYIYIYIYISEGWQKNPTLTKIVSFNLTKWEFST